MAVIVKSTLFLHFFSFEDDKLFQSVAAQNLTHGKGLAYYTVHANDFHTEIKVPLNRWPAGYSLLVALLYKLTDNLLVSTLLLDLVTIFFFLLLLRKLMRELEFPEFLINLLILFNGFTISIYLSMPTDLLAVVPILLTIILTIQFFKSQSTPYRSGILIGLCSFLPALFRYMYVPTSVLAGAALMIAALLQKNQKLKAAALSAMITSIVCVAGLLLFNKLYAGSSTYLMPMKQGFYPGNLLHLFPFVFGSFLNLNFLFVQLELLTNISYSSWVTIVTYINMLLCLVLIILSLKQKNRDRLKVVSQWNLFLWISLGIIVIAILLTAQLSIRNGPQIAIKQTWFWTFIGDGRYFVFAMIIIPLVAGRNLWISPAGKTGIVQYLFLFVLIVEISHTTWFLARKFDAAGSVSNATLPAHVKQYLHKRIHELHASDTEVVLTGYSENISHWAVLNNAKGLLNSDEILVEGPLPDSSTVLLLVVENEFKQQYQHYLSRSGSHLEAELGGFSIYSNSTRKNDD